MQSGRGINFLAGLKLSENSAAESNRWKPGTARNGKTPWCVFSDSIGSPLKPRSRTQRAGERQNASQLGSRELTRGKFYYRHRRLCDCADKCVRGRHLARVGGFIFATSETRSLTSSPSSERSRVARDKMFPRLPLYFAIASFRG